MAAFAAIVVAAASCGDPASGPVDEGDVFLSVPKTSVSNEAGSQFIKVTADGSWTLSVDGDWASLEQTSGSGSQSGITLMWDENVSSSPRKCTVRLESGSKSASQELTQDSRSSGSDPVVPGSGLKSDPVGAWMEVPAFSEGKGLYFITHDMKVGGYSGRNYSYALDPQAKLALWVAYPLNKSLIGSGSRSDDWGLDPKVPRKYQPVIYKAFRGGYERGHQLPSADRLSANESTFYGTNMTPQKGELNERAWATLEGCVRNWANSFDTLYVVTGADIKGSKSYAYDNDGKAVTVPTGYFKALLGYKKSGTVGISGKTRGYTGIAFYFEHKGYDEKNIMSQAMTIDALETKLGYDFFPNLVGKVGKENAENVESTRDSWWK